jgi:conjugative relaxase-like TrwC/TraI family protein
MLSVANVSAGMSSSYYEKDDYYSKEGSEKDGKAYSKWEGSLAKELKLKGSVELKDFENLLKGKIAKDITLGRVNGKGEREHSAGIDLTFSAPKSVSILSEIGGDERVLNAHRKAVSETLKFMESEFIRARVRKGASNSKDTKLTYETTGKAIIATYQHNVSRNLDPQLHTHAVIINATKTADGTWRSAEFYKVFSGKMNLGKLYRNELARNLRDIGYTIEQTHSDGRFELKEINSEIRKHFSTRRAEIELKLLDSKEQNAKTSANVSLLTRKVKQDVDRNLLKENWKERIDKFDINLENIIKHSKELSFQTKKTPAKELKLITKEAVNYAISHLSERDAVFEKSKVIGQALTFNEKTSLSLILKELNLRINNKELIEKDGRITSSNTLIMEKENIKLLEISKGVSDSIVKEFNVESLNKTSLNDGQKQSVSLILSSTDRVIGIQGSAGTGKTFMLNEARKLSIKEGYSIVGLAPSSSATLTLKQDANLTEAFTLQKFLKKYEGLALNRETERGLKQMKSDFQKKVIIVDEASMISTKQMNNLIKITQKLETKLVLVGDVKQLASVEAGKPFFELQKSGMRTAKMTEIVRQDNILLREAVQSAIKGNIKNAFEKIGNNIIEKEKGENISEIAVKEYFKLSKIDRDKTLILAPANETRKEINEIVRNNLQERGEISRKCITQMTLEAKNLSVAEKGESFNYKEGEVVVFNRNYKVHGVAKGENLEIKEVKHGLIILEKEGKQIKFELKGKPEIEVFKKSEKEISVGDKIRYLRNDKEFKIVNSHIAEVKDINKEKGEITLQEGKNQKTLKLSSSILQHIDYAYAGTVHASQGKTTKNVIAVLEGGKPLTNQQSFYVEISRAKENAILIVDNKQAVQRTLETNTGIKVSALDVVQDVKVRGYER